MSGGSNLADVYSYFALITHFIAKDNYANGMIAGLMSPGRSEWSEGRQIGIPYGIDSYGLLVNTDVLAKAGGCRRLREDRSCDQGYGMPRPFDGQSRTEWARDAGGRHRQREQDVGRSRRAAGLVGRGQGFGPGGGLMMAPWRRIERAIGENGTLGLFLMPALIVLLVAQLYPLVWSAWVSTVDWSLARSPQPRGFVGLANYAKAFSDPVMIGSLRTTVLLAVGSTALQMSIGFTLALLTLGEARTLRVVRTLLILPMVIAPVAVGTMWRMLLSARVGTVNRLLAVVGIAGPD